MLIIRVIRHMWRVANGLDNADLIYSSGGTRYVLFCYLWFWYWRTNSRCYKTFFFANKEFLCFLLLNEVILLSVIFSMCNKTLKLNSENQKTKKKSFIWSATENSENRKEQDRPKNCFLAYCDCFGVIRFQIALE